MATQTLTGDRRSFIAAGLATVVAVSSFSPAAVAAAPRAQWDASLATVNRLQRDMDKAFHAAGKAEKAYQAALPPTPGEGAEDKYVRRATELRQIHNLDFLGEAADDASDTFYDALHQMLAMPAPDLAAVIVKMEVSAKHGSSDEARKPVLSDLRRLAGGAA